MVAPVHRLKVAEIRALALGRCKHGHSYLEHYQCFLDENPEATRRLGFLDIETSNLDANFGIMLTYCIKDAAGEQILAAAITPEDIKKYDSDKSDTRIVQQAIDDIQKFDTLVTFYGKRFDVPFLRTRALVDGLKFPVFGSIKHIDVWDWARKKLRLNSNRLEVVCRTLFGETDKTHIEYKYWIGAARGDKDSIAWILDHNERDVNDLARVFYALEDFARRNDASI
jgi:uncharacterized protein YprB with RNaseH-like and TPR domain